MSRLKHIKPYQLFEAGVTAAALTAEQIDWLDKCAAGRWKLNPRTGLIDVDGDFYCVKQNLKDFKGVKFGKVSGSFYCDGNQLTTLVGAPQSVGGGFCCAGNQLTTLVGAPQTVSGDFYCENNQLTTLVGAPQSVGGGFYCRDNVLTTLVGAPQSVGGGFCCAGNPVSDSTLKSIFGLMKSGKSYQQALEERWPKMKDVDRVLMYKDHISLTVEEVRKYKALATYANIKGYL